ncbi:MAG TPA: hypothetical protein VGS19_37465 [Streptosporangiaceae bacterium]|nr:hypothetical protein [Streptosporangiaceae bacterium]
MTPEYQAIANTERTVTMRTGSVMQANGADGVVPLGQTGWLVLGGLHLLNGTAPVHANDPILLVPLGGPLETAVPSNTIMVRWDEIGEVELSARTVADGKTSQVSADGTDLFPGMLAGPAVRTAAWAVSAQPGTASPVVPLFYVSSTATDHGVELHVYSQIRFLAEDACFIRITPAPVKAPSVETLEWLPTALALHAQGFLFLNNHQRYYRKCFGGRELEYKYTLAPPVDIWTLTAELYQQICAGNLPGYIPEYRDEFQAWDYLNHLFEVTEPESERGYVSFIPTTDGKYLIKRKWYAEDTFDRRETHTYGVDVATEAIGRYVADEMRLTANRLPSFRRVRYDVNFESVRTGHVYGIFFDHCSLVDARGIVLHQCELEYLRSRTVLEPDERAVLAEIDDLARWLEAFLRDHGLSDQRGYYSKRTFLKDAVASHPELASTVR